MSGVFGVRGIRVYLFVESSGPVRVFSGYVSKTLVYSVSREARLFRGLRGVVSPVHISPLFSPGRRSGELGDLVSPLFDGDGVDPVVLGGEYVVHIGGDRGLVDLIERGLRRLGSSTLAVKYGDSFIFYRVEGVVDVTREVMEKTLGTGGDRVTVYIKGPSKPFNIFAPSRLPKMSISGPEFFMTPCLFYTGELSVTESVVLRCGRVLGKMVETWYSLRTVRPVLVPIRNRKEPALMGRATYIIDTKNEKERETISKILSIGEITGVGESRTNGFGTITWKSK